MQPWLLKKRNMLTLQLFLIMVLFYSWLCTKKSAHKKNKVHTTQLRLKTCLEFTVKCQLQIWMLFRLSHFCVNWAVLDFIDVIKDNSSHSFFSCFLKPFLRFKFVINILKFETFLFKFGVNPRFCLVFNER